MSQISTTAAGSLPDAILPLLVQATDWLLANSAPDGRLMIEPGYFDHRSWYDLSVLAVVYTTSVAGNPYYQDGRVADLIRRAGRALVAEYTDPSHINFTEWWYGEKRPDEWTVEAWLLSYDLLRQAGAGDLIVGWDDPLRKSGGTYLRYCQQVEQLRRMTSPNLKISTNHFAYFAADLIRIGQVFGVSDFVDRGLSVARKINAWQHPDGYWPETHGPTTSYNIISMGAIGLCHQYTGEAAFLDTLRRAKDFHARFTYPDSVAIETIDQRVRYPSGGTFGLYAFSHWPDGRGWAELRFRHALPTMQTTAGKGDFGRLASSYLYYRRGPIEPPLFVREDYRARLSDLPAGVARRDPWVVALSGIPSRPRNHHYTLDRQNLLSIWHRDCGLIIGGGGDRDNPTAATFYARIMNDPTAVEHGITHEDAYLPVNATLALDSSGGSLDLEYWGFDARLDVRAMNPTTCRITAFAGSLPVNGPVLFNLNLMLRSDQPLVTGAGASIPLGGEPADLVGQRLGGWIGQGRWRLSVPADARLRYPVVPFIYNTKYIAAQRLAVLSAPVTNSAATLTLEVSG